MLRSINSFFPPKVHNGPSTKQKEKIKNKWIFVNIQYMYATPATKPTVTENKSKIKSLKNKNKKKKNHRIHLFSQYKKDKCICQIRQILNSLRVQQF